MNWIFILVGVVMFFGVVSMIRFHSKRGKLRRILDGVNRNMTRGELREKLKGIRCQKGRLTDTYKIIGWELPWKFTVYKVYVTYDDGEHVSGVKSGGYSLIQS